MRAVEGATAFLVEAFIGAEAVIGAAIGVLGFAAKDVYQGWRSKRSKPSLTLDAVADLAPGKVNGKSCSYGRLSVSNAGDRETATGVSVRITRVTASVESDGARSLSERSLAWAEADRGKPNVDPRFITVPGGSTRQFDLVHLNESVSKAMIVDVRPQPGNRLNYLSPGSYVFELTVSADNAGTRKYAVDVEFTGGWNGDYGAAPRHLTLTNLRSLS